MKRQVIVDGIIWIVKLKVDNETGGYTASVPDLPGCFSKGATILDALENSRDVIEAYAEGYAEGRAKAQAIVEGR